VRSGAAKGSGRIPARSGLDPGPIAFRSHFAALQPVQSLPASLVRVLKHAGPPAENLAQPIELLERICTRLGAGELIDLRPAVCLAFGLPPLLVPALSAIEPVSRAPIEPERA
jgi:hypothetical protein